MSCGRQARAAPLMANRIWRRARPASSERHCEDARACCACAAGARPRHGGDGDNAPAPGEAAIRVRAWPGSRNAPLADASGLQPGRGLSVMRWPGQLHELPSRPPPAPSRSPGVSRDPGRRRHYCCSAPLQDCWNSLSGSTALLGAAGPPGPRSAESRPADVAANLSRCSCAGGKRVQPGTVPAGHLLPQAVGGARSFRTIEKILDEAHAAAERQCPVTVVRQAGQHRDAR